MKVSVLGIGTELTTGQILNLNGQWISNQMKSLGVSTSCHLVVPDDKEQIRQSLDFCMQQSDMIFITGGLGPTTDDFTREVVADWAGKKLFFHADSWAGIESRLNSRGLKIRDFQKQQCYYPEDAKIYINSSGTANAFSFEYKNKKIYCLPGPPREIKTIWNEFLATEMAHLTKGIDAYLTVSWDCLGEAESEIAYLAESALLGCNLEKGYRVHLPYVEMKLSYFRSKEADAQRWIQAVDKALKPMAVLKNGEDAAETLAKKIHAFKKVIIMDALSGIHLLQRLFPFIKDSINEKKIQYHTKETKEEADLILKLEPEPSSTARISYRLQNQTRTDIIACPFSSLLMKEREKQYYAEMALLFWMKNI